MIVQMAITEIRLRKYDRSLANDCRSLLNDFFVNKIGHSISAALRYRSQTWKISEKSSFIQAMEIGVKAQNSNIAMIGNRTVRLVLGTVSITFCRRILARDVSNDLVISGCSEKGYRNNEQGLENPLGCHLPVPLPV